MGTTPNFGFPYPELGDPPDGATQTSALANAVDSTLAAQVAALLADINGIAEPVYAYKTTQSGFPVGTTLTSDPDLVLDLTDPAAVYHVTGTIRYDAGTATQYQHKFVVPASANFYYNSSFMTLTTGAPNSIATQNGVVIPSFGNGGGNPLPLSVDGLLIMGGSTGELIYQASNQATGGIGWSQYEGSYLRARKISPA